MNERQTTGFDPMVAPRYGEIATFMRTPYAATAEGVDIALIGVPYDGGTTNRAGARHGPREIRNMSSLMRSIHHVSRCNPYELCRVADLGDVRFTRIFEDTAVVEEIAAFYRDVHRHRAFPLTAGGDHSITYPIFRAIAADESLGMVHIDAHTDTWDEFQGSRFTHGAPFRRAVEDGLLDPGRTIQIGIRGAQNTSEGWDYSLDQGMRVVFMEEFDDMGVDATIEEARRVVGDGPTYISFDVDGLDPVYAPGTGTPEIGGMTTIDAQRLLRGLGGLDLRGGDVVEVAPPFDQTGNTALVGATMMYEILCLLAQARGAHGNSTDIAKLVEAETARSTTRAKGEVKPLPPELEGSGLTTSAKIRVLDQLGWPRATIARSLDVRYQHVRNVLEAGPPKRG